jgi:GntR family transcriptional regulator, transcriptional repressor for pyruvate dehydrogenase complex
MGVSRTVIRESLTRLKTLGIIEAIKHKGTIIKSPDLSALLSKSMIPRMLDNTTLKDIFELRLVIEIGMADLVFKHITPEDIAELEQIIKIEPEKSDDVLFDIEHEIKFHGKLYEIAKNETLKKFQQILLPVFNYIYDSGLVNKPIQRKIHVSHQGLVDVLKKELPMNFVRPCENIWKIIFSGCMNISKFNFPRSLPFRIFPSDQ